MRAAAQRRGSVRLQSHHAREQPLLQRLSDARDLRWRPVRDDAPSEAEDESDDTVNAWVVAHARTRPVDDVLAEFRWAHDRLVKAIEACAEADLQDPDRLPFTKGKALLAILPGQCWGHHRQHLPQLQEFARKTPLA